MGPPLALDARREEIRGTVGVNRGMNPRVFEPALHREDTEASDLDVSFDAVEGLSLFDRAEMFIAISNLLHAKIDVKTPGYLPVQFRKNIFAEARLA